MKNILIIFAHPAEAKQTLKRLNVCPLTDNYSYSFEQGPIAGHVVITGMGSLQAALHTRQWMDTCDEIWNWGAVGALRDGLPIGLCQSVCSIDKHLSLPPSAHSHVSKVSGIAHPPLSIASEGWKLLTSDYPIHEAALRQKLGAHHDVVDMEGYGIALAAKLGNKPCKMWKCVSDFASEQGWSLIQKHLQMLSEQIAEDIFKELNTLKEKSQNDRST
jgi:adenosylhomocysteine nucleosidase